MPPRLATFESKIVPTAAGQVEVLVAGSGPPLVVVHASGMPPPRYARLAARWTDRYTVMLPQLIGYGATGPFSAATWSIASEADVLGAVLDTIDGPVDVFAHSFGGWIALVEARRRPARFASLSLYEPTLFGLLHEARHGPGLKDLAPFIDDPWFLDRARIGDETWMGAYVDYWNQAKFWSVMTPPQRKPLMDMADKIFAEVHAVLTDRTPAASWAGIDVPMLLLRGERTTPAAAGCTDLFAPLVPRLERATVERGGHLAPLVRVVPIAERIAEHIEAHRPG